MIHYEQKKEKNRQVTVFSFAFCKSCFDQIRTDKYKYIYIHGKTEAMLYILLNIVRIFEYLTNDGIAFMKYVLILYL